MDPNQQVPPQPLVSTQPLNKPRFSPSTLRLIGLSLCVLSIGIAIAVVGYLWYVSKHTSAASGQTQTKSLTTASITAWKTYTNNQYSLSFKYPNNWIESTCHHLFVFLAPKKQLLGQCPEHGGGIGYGYLIEFDMSNLQNWTDYGLPSYEDYTKALRYTDLSYLDQGKRENVTISGYPGIKISGTIKEHPRKLQMKETRSSNMSSITKINPLS